MEIFFSSKLFILDFWVVFKRVNFSGFWGPAYGLIWNFCKVLWSLAHWNQKFCLVFASQNNVIPNLTTSIYSFRPFTFALHSLIGVGFLAATFLVKPFLPQDEPNDNSQNSICYQNVTETIETSSHNALLGGVPKIAWPFIISGAWCIVFCSGFAILSMYLTWVVKDFSLVFLVRQLFFWQLIIDFFLQDYFFWCRPNIIKNADIADCLKKQSGNSLKTNNWLKNVRNIVDGLN